MSYIDPADKSKITRKFGRKLCEQRRRVGMSLAEVAVAADMTLDQARDLERGNYAAHRSPEIGVVERYADALGLTLTLSVA